MRKVFATALRLALPWRFWRVISMEQPVAPGRLVGALAAMYGGIMLLGCAVVASGMTFIIVVYSPGAWATASFADLAREFFQCMKLWFPLGDIAFSLSSAYPRGETQRFLLICACIAVLPLAMLLLPQSRREARVRRAHLWRGAAYTVLGLGAIIGARLTGLAGVFAYNLITEILQSPRQVPWWLAELAHGTQWLYLLVAAWGAVMWRSFVASYLRMRHSWAVTLLLGAVAVLLVLVLTSLAVVLGWLPPDVFVGWLAVLLCV